MSTAHAQLLEELRPPTFAIAYRMLGSVGEAEDVVQETLHAGQRPPADSPSPLDFKCT